jgi:hypothetical protein
VTNSDESGPDSEWDLILSRDRVQGGAMLEVALSGFHAILKSHDWYRQ